MKNLSLFLLLCLLFAACAKDEDKEPILVTDIVMPTQASFKPGDPVTIKAQGFQPDDDIMFEIYWPLPDEPALNYQGSALGVAPVMVEQTATSITFLAPGHYPASTTKVRLRRSGDIMTLGEIAVTGGEAPKEFQLYGIVNSHSSTSYDNCIEHVNFTDTPTNIVKLTEDQKDFSCVANVPESQNLCGIQTKDGVRRVFSYDLSMRFWQDMGLENILTLCNSQSSIIAVRQISANEMMLASIGSWPYTRDIDQTLNYRYELPAEIKPEALTRYPGVQGGSYLLLSADNGNNSFTPVVLSLNQSSRKVYTGQPIQATALIPFWTIISGKDTGTTKYVRTGGYAVVRADDGQTDLCLWNQAKMSLEKPFATFPNSARSVTMLAQDTETMKIYVLFDTNRGGRLIYAYDLVKKDWQRVPDNYPYSEIVMAR
ncbi:WD40-like domain containing protein [Bacteroides intestinalis]|uniref:WD40-like domain containing protein n=1 Tax=Bacteroides intestinalis TaxID=329854 RepID=UPI00189CA164|nr:WD40-like domain containing protein [Bacteroides intestinalis]